MKMSWNPIGCIEKTILSLVETSENKNKMRKEKMKNVEERNVST